MARKGGFRHLVYFIDGTWLWAGSDSTFEVYSNIYLLNTLLKADDKDGRAQIVHYSRGLGAVDGIRKYTSGGFAYGIDDLVADLYINICSNYEPGDRLYIFGFSRGAVVARALSGLLSKGILKEQHANMFSHVWRDYVATGDVALAGITTVAPKHQEKIAEYKNFCWNTDAKIEFLGVFETVAGGHGVSEVAQQLRLGQRNLLPNVKHALQLLAIDESRSFFSPIMWTGMKEPSKADSLEQIWVAGVHSDLGGAYRSRLLGNVSLLTMIDRVITKTDLTFDLPACREYNKPPDRGELVQIHNEYTRLWRLFCPFPESRRIDQNIVQHLHPFTKALNRHPVKYKGVPTQTAYHLADAFERLPVLEKEFLSGEFKPFSGML
jgi:uncharacterized protein (DUF2235 family)